MKTLGHLVLFIVVFLSSCASNHRTYSLVTHHQPRTSTLGFSITPPPGKNWYEKYDKNTLYYLKRTPPFTYLLTTQAKEIKFSKPIVGHSDLIYYLKKNTPLQDNRFHKVETEYSKLNTTSEHCLQYQYHYEDHGNAAPSLQPITQVKQSGVICNHPERPIEGIDISYKEQYYLDTEDASFEDEGKSFLKTLQILPSSKG